MTSCQGNLKECVGSYGSPRIRLFIDKQTQKNRLTVFKKRRLGFCISLVRLYDVIVEGRNHRWELDFQLLHLTVGSERTQALLPQKDTTNNILDLSQSKSSSMPSCPFNITRERERNGYSLWRIRQNRRRVPPSVLVDAMRLHQSD